MTVVMGCAVGHMIRQCFDCVVNGEGSMDRRGIDVQLTQQRSLLKHKDNYCS